MNVKLMVKGYGLMEVQGLTAASLPAMKLVQFHSPDFTVNCWDGKDFIRIRIADVDLQLSPTVHENVNADRAQLAALGSSQG